MNANYKFAIVDDETIVAVRVFKTEAAALAALRFWNRNGERYSLFPIDGVSA